MANFNIAFNYQGVEYSADVNKVPFVNNFPVQFHVTNINPLITGVPDPYIFIHDPKKEVFDFAPYDDSSELPGIIINAVKTYCTENDISLTT